MKKRTLVNWVLLIFILTGAVKSNATGDDNIMFGNWQNPMTGQFVNLDLSSSAPPSSVTLLLFPGGILSVNLNVLVASQEVSAHPPIYIEYTFGPYSGITPAVQKINLVPDTLSDGKPVFIETFHFDFDFSEECSRAENGEFDILVSLTLVTDASGGGTIIYPVLAEDELFPPEWFAETTSPFPAPSMSAIKTLNCRDIDPVIDARKKRQTPDPETEFATNIYPNPFSDDFQLEYLLESSAPLSITVMDRTGKICYEKKYFHVDEGLHEERMQLEDLLPGIYFLQLTTQQTTKTLRLVKSGTL